MAPRGRNKIVWMLLVVLLLVGLVSYAIPRLHPVSDPTSTVRETVIAFGAHQKEVSLLSPNAASELASAYGRYVSPGLIKAWQNDPANAPGRLTSSPWPDRISIDHMQAIDASTYQITGTVILMTSNEVAHGGTAGSIPVTLTVTKEGNAWLISKYKEERAPGTTPIVGTQTIETGINTGASTLGVVIMPLAVVEDSRCPVDVQCIQAGTVRVRARLTVDTNPPQDVVFQLGTGTTTLGARITLTKATPTKESKKTIVPADYLFTFVIERK